MQPLVNKKCRSDFRTESSESDGFVIVEPYQITLKSKKDNPIPVLYVPEGFDPQEHLAPERRHLADRARYLLHIMHARMIFNHRKRKEGQGVRLKTEYLRSFMGRAYYQALRQDLEDHGVIEFSKKCCTGRSFEYRFAGDFRTQSCRRFTPTDTRLIKKLREYRAKANENLTCPTRRHLRDQLRRVRIDIDAARNELAGLNLTEEGFVACLNCLTWLVDKEWYFVADEYGRVHHNISCLKRELRKHLRVDGEGLVELDIANSQPLFCGLAYCHWTTNGSSLSGFHSKDSFSFALSLKQDNIESFLSPFPFTLQQQEEERQTDIPLRWQFEDIVSNDAVKYLKLCEQGEFYEYLAKASGTDISTDKKRNRFKEKVFSNVLFAKKKHMTNPLAKTFEAEYPSIYEMIISAKKPDDAGLAHWMQRVESSFVIDRVVSRFLEERPKSFVLTIHDSVMTKPQDADFAHDLLMNEFRQFGVRPTLRMK